METIKKSDIRTGDGFAYSGHSPLAREVQKMQYKIYPGRAAKFNHAGLFVEIGGELMVSEAVINGIQLTNFDHYINDRKEHFDDILVCLRPKFQVRSGEVLLTALKASGTTHYDFVNLGFYQLVRMISRDKLWLGGKKVDNKYICYEWVCHIWNMFTEFCPNEKRMAPADAILDNRLDKFEIII
jgi:hypothetical protein